ncbi:MAG: cobaltochelatase subunit CobN, partial [Gluconacetobacter diazotrophicus]|nr:cobaltochelatase subunit CobN [Gluconacetobacter diazotrophicus]
ALVGAVPVITPFIVNNPGEAAQAKRRIGALTLGHLTPPMVDAGTHGETAELEQLFDEYAEALALDPRRARLIGRTILDLARERDLLPEPARAADPESALAVLDNWLCDIKETRIGDGLHTFGRTCQVSCDPTSRPSGHLLSKGEKGAEPVAADLLDACGPAERAGLSRALDGRFVPPGPSGAPSRGRLDVLPTGRNLYSVDPRGVPTRTAAEIGVRMAEDLCTRYAQDHGDWPRSVMLDLWGSASMRTGGDDLAQAFALLGTRPRWDHGSGRVSGFDILPLARLGRARVDVTLRISGLFRDAFPDQIRLFDAAVRAVADLDEEDADNPLAAAHRQRASLIRVFGAAPGQYGVGVAEALTLDAETARDVLGTTYIDASAHPFGAAAEPAPAADLFRDRVAAADAFSHTTDLPGQDVLESDTLAEHLGGFAAAAALLGTRPSLYHADASRPDVVRLRGLADAVTEALHARATNPRWITGQMRHGHRGAISLGETLDALCTLAATTTSVPSRHFDLYFDATLGDDTVRAFLHDANPAVARDMARRFATARANGWWHTRRNSVGMILADMCPDQHGRLPSSADLAGRIRAVPEVVT